MKTNVSIKFNSIEEYREIEKKLEELGYENDKGWNERELIRYQKGQVSIYDTSCNGNNTCLFSVFRPYSDSDELVYNSLEEFLKD